MYHVRSVVKDPVATWQKLKEKYERVSEMEAEVVQQLLKDFQHVKTGSADETIDRFEKIFERCHQQGVPATERHQQRMLLSKPNERYIYLKKKFQYAEFKPSFEESILMWNSYA